MAGVELRLVSPARFTTYTGMLPGLVIFTHTHTLGPSSPGRPHGLR